MVQALRVKFGSLIDSVIRYPLAIAFLTATAVLTAIDISDGGMNYYTRYILTCVIGAVSGAAAQSAYERFFTGARWRSLLYAAVFLLTVLFYLSVAGISENSMQTGIRAAVTIFALFFVYIWIATVKSDYSFSDSFMAAFKAFFQALFFSGVIFLGCAAIIAAINTLITPIDSKAYAHSANIIFILIAPLFFLSLIPVYPGRAYTAEAELPLKTTVEKRIHCPKFLEVLLSYIIIPLASVFTAILLIYIIMNIGGKFWTNNLLEPLLISYSITIIIVTLLVSKLENKFAVLFRRIFPKVLIPIALFQVLASVLLMADTGVTYSRYYVILYGTFAVLSGCALSLPRFRRSGAVAVLLIVLSAISVIPPIDAFTVARNSQISSLENILIKDGMLGEGDLNVRPNDKIPEADKAKIIASIQYLASTDELSRVKWLPAGFNGYDDTVFFSTFGFHQYSPSTPGYRYISVYFNTMGLLPIAGYDIFTQITIPSPDKQGTAAPETVDVNGRSISLVTEPANGTYVIVIKETAGPELLRFDTKQLFDRYMSYPAEKALLTQEEATFTAENDKLAMTLIVLNAGMTTAPDSKDENAQLLVFIKLK